LFKAVIGFATNAYIQREENKNSRRLLSKGRVLTQEDVDRLKAEDLEKQELAA
ncbi:uncharacterized protein K441DRAFT_663215, partial [Cenococcum geophilum 1.58]|uniref:uncharacterized protein n=1 Tax=Cenococcum geophilum 1.58 TaxID=794803 RepID=UPI00358EF0AF